MPWNKFWVELAQSLIVTVAVVGIVIVVLYVIYRKMR